MVDHSRSRFLPAAIALVLAGCVGLHDPTAPGTQEGAIGLGRSGFRYDPMRFVQTDDSVQGAMVRTLVFENPLPTDGALLQARIGEIVREAEETAAKPDSNPADVLGRTRELVELGCPTDHSRIEESVRMARAALRDADVTKGMEGEPFYALQTLCTAGVTDAPGVAAALRWQVAHPDKWIGKGCPWGTKLTIQTLWAGRTAVDTIDAIGKGLQWMADGMNEAGCLEYFDPWGFLDAAGTVHHPLAREVVLKQLPMVLRAQKPDGGWGRHSFVVFRALVKHGLLDPLRRLPALPPDWRVVRSIPVTGQKLRDLSWDGKRFWVYSPEEHLAIAVSPVDGTVRGRVRLPEGEVAGIGWVGDALAVARKSPKRLQRVDADSGAVLSERPLEQVHDVGAVAADGDGVCVADLWMPGVWVFDVEGREPGHYRRLAGPLPCALAASGQGVWHVDLWAGALIKSGPEGQLLDWGEAPFGQNTAGVAWDGHRLWALDAAGKRICALARSPKASLSYDWLKRTTEVCLQPILSAGETFTGADTRLLITNRASIPVRVTGVFELNRWLWPQPHSFAVDVPADSAEVVPVRVDAVGAPAPGQTRPLVVRWSAVSRPARGSRSVVHGDLSVPVLPTYECPRRSAPVRVDGDLSEWADLPFACTEPGQVLMAPDSWNGPQDCSFRFGVSFDDGFVYVAVEVFDDRVVADGASSPWFQDGVEVRIDARPPPARSSRGAVELRDVLLVAVAPGATAEAPVIHAAERMPEGLRAGCRRTNEGHVSEIAIPAAYLDTMQGGEWRSFRLNIAVDDHDGAARDRTQAAQLWWQPDWRQPEDVPGSGTFRR